MMITCDHPTPHTHTHTLAAWNAWAVTAAPPSIRLSAHTLFPLPRIYQQLCKSVADTVRRGPSNNSILIYIVIYIFLDDIYVYSVFMVFLFLFVFLLLCASVCAVCVPAAHTPADVSPKRAPLATSRAAPLWIDLAHGVCVMPAQRRLSSLCRACAHTCLCMCVCVCLHRVERT